MQKYWGKQFFTFGRFPKVGQKQKTDEKKRRPELVQYLGRKVDRLVTLRDMLSFGWQASYSSYEKFHGIHYGLFFNNNNLYRLLEEWSFCTAVNVFIEILQQEMF